MTLCLLGVEDVRTVLHVFRSVVKVFAHQDFLVSVLVTMFFLTVDSVTLEPEPTVSYFGKKLLF